MSEIDDLRAALEPFARKCREMRADLPDSAWAMVGMGDLRNLLDAYNKLAAPRPSPDKGRRTGSGALHGRPLDEDGAIEFRPSPEKDEEVERVVSGLESSMAGLLHLVLCERAARRDKYISMMRGEFDKARAAIAALSDSNFTAQINSAWSASKVVDAAVARARAEAFREAMRTVRNEMPSGHPLRYVMIEALRRARTQEDSNV